MREARAGGPNPPTGKEKGRKREATKSKELRRMIFKQNKVRDTKNHWFVPAILKIQRQSLKCVE